MSTIVKNSKILNDEHRQFIRWLRACVIFLSILCGVFLSDSIFDVISAGLQRRKCPYLSLKWRYELINYEIMGLFKLYHVDYRDLGSIYELNNNLLRFICNHFFFMFLTLTIFRLVTWSICHSFLTILSWKTTHRDNDKE